MTPSALRQWLYDYLKRHATDALPPRIWQGATCSDGWTWGSYQVIRAADLEGREFVVRDLGDKPGVLWLDVNFDPRTKRYVPATK